MKQVTDAWLRTLMPFIICLLACAGCSHASHVTAHATSLAPPPKQTTTTPCDPAPPLIDSRQSATGFIISYYNALDRQDYRRAYGYFMPLMPAELSNLPAPPAFDQWQAGYATTKCVIITAIGAEMDATSATAGFAGIGAAKVAPVQLTAILSDDSLMQFAGQYAIRYNPGSDIARSGAIDLSFSYLTSV